MKGFLFATLLLLSPFAAFAEGMVSMSVVVPQAVEDDVPSNYKAIFHMRELPAYTMHLTKKGIRKISERLTGLPTVAEQDAPKLDVYKEVYISITPLSEEVCEPMGELALCLFEKVELYGDVIRFTSKGGETLYRKDEKSLFQFLWQNSTE